MEETNTVKRAFELAKGGTCQNVEAIRQRLTKEGYSGVQTHLAGITIRKQLLAIIKGTG